MALMLESLKKHIEEAQGPDRELEILLADTIGEEADYPGSHLFHANGRAEYLRVAAPRYTSSIDAATALVERALPGFWQSSGLCTLSGHASIGPDYNGPQGDRLRADWPEDRFHSGFDADLKPGDGCHRQCLALLHAMVQALMAREACTKALGDQH